MNSSNVNIIQKQILNLHYNGKMHGFVLQEEVTDWFYRELFPDMQMMIDKISPTGLHVRLDRLEISLSIKSGSDWKQILRKQVLDNLEKRLRPEIQFERSAGMDSKLKPADNFLLLLKHYLQNGFLPWWSSVKLKNDFEVMLDEWLLSEESRKQSDGIKSILTEKDVMYRISLFADNYFDGFIKLLMGNKSFVSGLQPLKKDVSAISKQLSQTKRDKMNLFFKQAVLENVIEANPDLKAIAITFVNRAAESFADELRNLDTSVIRSEQIKEAIFNLNKPEDIFLKEKTTSSGEKEANDKKSLSKEVESALSEKEITDKKDSEKKIDESDIHLLKEDSPVQTEPGIAKQNERNDRGQKKVDISGELKEGIFIQNAGLVIVAGFLPMFFKKLSLLREGFEIADNSKAALLVQYLASGKESIAEFELGLAKILCGLEMETVVETIVQLTDEEKKEANELLLSVIEYWSILGNTSVGGLRDSFLMREGKLSFNDHEWILQVEQRPYDMLLQNLPWNISMIKLPWMKWMLKTEWIY